MPDPIRIHSGPAISAGQTPPGAPRPRPAEGPSFAEALSEVQNLKFSSHAQKRLQTRNIALSDEGISRLAGAIDKAEKRGGKESLVLVDDLAFIVNVKERLVITAMDANHRGEGVFTQIDSVVFADPGTPKEGHPAQTGKTHIA